MGTQKLFKNRIILFIIALFFVLSILSIVLPQSADVPEGAVSEELTLIEKTEGNQYRADYVDADGKVAFASDKYYATILRELNEGGQVLAEYYYDENGNPAVQPAGNAGLKREYDEKGQNTRIIYTDENGDPVMTMAGYAMILRTCDAEGRVVQLMYLDESGQPVAGTIGQYGVAYEYDREGRQYKVTYLDKEGAPVMTSFGYATVLRTFDAENRVDTEMYYDTEGEQVRLSHGQYGIKNSNGRRLYVDKNGNVFFSLSQFLYTFPWAAVLFGLLICVLAIVLPKKWIPLLLVLYILFILYMTLLFRDSGDPKGQFEVFWSYRDFFSNRYYRIEILQNMWMFVPLGTLLRRLFEKRWIMLVPLLVSVLIECIQYFTGLGLFEFDDMISNLIGGCIGYYLGFAVNGIVTERKARKLTSEGQ